jgi:predicted DNA binding CopG/RHH family protein
MKKETGKVVEGTFGRMREVEDFLPSPAELAQAPEVVKVTIGLSSDSIEFFKEQAKQHNTSYQRMIRRLLDEYVAQVRAAEEVKQPR